MCQNVPFFADGEAFGIEEFRFFSVTKVLRMDENSLTGQAYWDEYWEKVDVPQEVRKGKKSLYLNEILTVFDTYLPRNESWSILEIGGAPGQYLAYMHRNFGYHVSCLDYSKRGCEKTRKNFELLQIPADVYEADLFHKELLLPSFDIVYSLGFIEHFVNLDHVVERHLDFLKPGGFLVVGTPNFLGINCFFLRRLCPERLVRVNLHAMDISNWASFEEKYKLVKVFKGYVGGFEPSIFNRREQKTFSAAVLKQIAEILTKLFRSHFKFFRKWNSKYVSGYVMAVYRKAGL